MQRWLVRSHSVRIALTALTAASLIPAAYALRPQNPNGGGLQNAQQPGDEGGFGGGQGGQGGFGGGPGGGQGGFRGGQGGQRPMGGGMMGGMMMARDVKPFQVPAATLASLLHLSSEQKTRVDTAITRLSGRVAALRPAQGQGDNTQGGGGRQQMQRIDPTRMQSLFQTATTDIEGALNSTQKQRLTTVLAAIRVLRDAGLPIPLTGQIELTDDQVDKLAALAPKDDPQNGGGFRQQAQRQQTTNKTLPSNVATLLTAGQKDLIEPWLAVTPMAGPGGMGGPGMGGRAFAFGGPGGGGPGGGGPDGGFGGPPGGGPGGPGGDPNGGPPPPPNDQFDEGGFLAAPAQN